MFNVTRLLPRALQFQSVLTASFRFYATTSSMNANPDIGRILSFWCDGPDPMQRWFSPKPGFDQEIHDKFGDLMKQARTTQLDSWTEETNGSLAMLILLDQFPRNVWRNTADAFSSDAKALDIASRSVIKGFDRQVSPLQQQIFYLPFMHGESIVSQVASIALLEGALARLDDAESEAGKTLVLGLQSARGHAIPICKFGRFPARNAALGRESTKEEEDFLKDFPRGF